MNLEHLPTNGFCFFFQGVEPEVGGLPIQIHTSINALDKHFRADWLSSLIRLQSKWWGVPARNGSNFRDGLGVAHEDLILATFKSQRDNPLGKLLRVVSPATSFNNCLGTIPDVKIARQHFYQSHLLRLEDLDPQLFQAPHM